MKESERLRAVAETLLRERLELQQRAEEARQVYSKHQQAFKERDDRFQTLMRAAGALESVGL